jgi:hypothetical protein
MRRNGYTVVLMIVGACPSACSLFTDLRGFSEPSHGDAAPTSNDSGDAGVEDSSPSTTDGESDAPVTLPQDPYAKAVLADGPIAYFRLDDTSGSICRNEVANGAITCVFSDTGLTWNAPGFGGTSRGVHFDAMSGRIVVNGAMTFKGKEPYAIEMWVKHDGQRDVARNMDTLGGLSGTTLFISNEGTFRTESWVAGTHIFYVQSAQKPSSTKFTHVVFGYSDEAERDYMFIDGVEAGGTRVHPGEHVAPSSALEWGDFTGTVDEIAIYAKALTSARVDAHLAARPVL